MLTNRITLAHLTDADLDTMHGVAMNVWDNANALGAFASDILQEEMIRRLTGRAPVADAVPSDWSAQDIAEALTTAPAFAFAAATATAREFSKQLTASISAAAAARLTLN
ncbi:hypothetical protein [Lacipirellula sp.]|uniref:hypothetical protein n=1 Tax=Lacipirellula sp. TaxID=2691419 RepID=UPI003D1097EC